MSGRCGGERVASVSDGAPSSMRKVLSIAGSDSSGGAGIQADLKTICAHGMYGMTVITSLTAQNTTGVSAILDATPEFVTAQMDAVFTDIFPDAVKIGMVSSDGLISAIASGLVGHGAGNIVIDPVMVATTGARLLTEGAQTALIEHLLPLGDIITPNIPEACVLSGIDIEGPDDMVRAAHSIARLTKGAVLVKGGHLSGTADDLLHTADGDLWLTSPRIDTQDVHGTGCTLSSAIACNLAAGLSAPEAVRRAKAYLTAAIGSGLHLGHGHGPVDHLFAIRPSLSQGSLHVPDLSGPYVLIVGGSPHQAPPDILVRLAAGARSIIAADAGYTQLRRLGIRPDHVVGDFDSMAQDDADELIDGSSHCGIQVTRVPSEKDFTDLELALDTARRMQAGRVVLSGVSAGRLDHMLGVIGACARATDLAPAIVEGDLTVCFLDSCGRSSSCRLAELGLRPGDTYGVMAIDGRACLAERGVRYPLDGQYLDDLDPRGVSNVMLEDDAVVEVMEGKVAVIVCA